jgi:hypothetical protein
MSGLVTDEKERKMDPIHIRDVGGKNKEEGGESVMNPSVSQSWTHKHQLSLLPIKPRRRPHTHREGCHVYRLKKLNRKKGDERNRTQFLRQSKCHRQLEKVIITRATSECSSPSKNSENKNKF